MTFSDIGEILGKTENWARVVYYRAKTYYGYKEKGLIGMWTTSQGDVLAFDENQNVTIEAVQCADTLEDGDAFYVVHMNDVLRINQGDSSIEFTYKIRSGKLYLEMAGKNYLTLEKANN